MKIEEIIASIDELDFDSVIRMESRDYLTKGYKLVPFLDKEDDKKFITNGLKRFFNKSDKIIFLLEAINYLNAELSDVSEKLEYTKFKPIDYSKCSLWELESHQNYQQLNRRKLKHEAQIFYAVRELEKLGLIGLDKGAFSNTQVNDLTRRINALLIKIDELTVGQEIIYNFIDEFKIDLKELKHEFPLGNKRWHQRFTGVVASYLGNKGADALYDFIKPDIMQIIKETALDRLLH